MYSKAITSIFILDDQPARLDMFREKFDQYELEHPRHEILVTHAQEVHRSVMLMNLMNYDIIFLSGQLLRTSCKPIQPFLNDMPEPHRSKSKYVVYDLPATIDHEGLITGSLRMAYPWLKYDELEALINACTLSK